MCAGLYFYQPLSDKQHCQKVKVVLGIVWSLSHNHKNHGGLWTLVNSAFDVKDWIEFSRNWLRHFWRKMKLCFSPGNGGLCQRARASSLKEKNKWKSFALLYFLAIFSKFHLQVKQTYFIWFYSAYYFPFLLAVYISSKMPAEKKQHFF